MVFLVVTETIGGWPLVDVAIVQCLFNPLYSSRRFVVFAVPSEVF